MRTTIVIPAIAFSTLSLVACGGGGDGGTADPVDGSSAVDARASDGGGATIDAAPAACTAPSSFGDAGALTAEAFFVPDVDEGTDDGATDDLLVLFAPLETGATPDVIELRLFAGYGAFAGGAIRTGTFQLTGPELDVLECGICAGVITDTTMDGYADDYLPTGGTLELTAIGTAAGQMLTGRLTNLTFRHTIVAEDGTSTPADDTCATMVTSATFSATLVMDPGGDMPR
ncbi:MAG TPA: hypothetical protein VM261_19580 [Kofleriaceae bacterium]|nr:hypothetical protein [Kofleriaceae bacterium]